MKVTVDLPSEDLERICMMAGTEKKGPAIRCILEESLRLFVCSGNTPASTTAEFVSVTVKE